MADETTMNWQWQVGLLRRGDRLPVFFTAIRDAPEPALLSTLDLKWDWTM